MRRRRATVGLRSRVTIQHRMREGTFPRQVRLGPNSVAWRQSDIARWVESPSTYSVPEGRK
ncbi:TPA: AlpA family phage regulatory protein [Pseudomonas aeruginosa]|nr:AlpA family phage regulatory protein [Pseudomonas aeruginosa]